MITFSQFEECILLSETQNLLAETRDNAESGNNSDGDSTMPPLNSEEKMDAMSSGGESGYEPMYMEMIEDICDVSQSHPRVNSKEARYKIHDCIKLSREKYKGALLSAQKWVKVYTKHLRLSLMRFCKFYQFLLNLDQKFPISFQNLETFLK